MTVAVFVNQDSYSLDSVACDTDGWFNWANCLCLGGKLCANSVKGGEPKPLIYISQSRPADCYSQCCQVAIIIDKSWKCFKTLHDYFS